MNYSKVDYEFLASSTPVNGTAASVVSKPVQYSSGEEAREEYINIGIALRGMDRALSTLEKGSDERKALAKRKTEIQKRRVELKAKYPALGLRGRDANGYVLDELRKRVTKGVFEACVRVGMRNMEEDKLAGREIVGAIDEQI